MKRNDPSAAHQCPLPGLRLPLLASVIAGIAIGLWAGCGGAGNGMDPDGTGAGAGTPGSRPGTGTPPGGAGSGGIPLGPDGKTPGASTCVADRVSVPGGQNCKCECTDCLCTNIQCTCDGSCYGQADCLVNSDGEGNATVGGGFGADCQSKSCVPEDDLTNELHCSFSDCQFNPNLVQLNPDEAPADLDLERGVKNTGLIITVDTSSSMTNKQAYSACAADAFIKATQGAEWSVGVMTQDITKVPNSSSGNGDMPPLLQVSGSCSPATSCSCGGNYAGQICKFAPGGKMTSSNDANALDALRGLIVQGSNEASAIDEAGLEKAFLYVMGLIRQGRGAEVSQVIAISDEEANSDNKMCPIQARRDIAGLRAVLGPAFNPPANTGKCDADLTRFYSYFFKFVNVRVNALVDTTGTKGEKGQIYMDVAAATGGSVADLQQCGAFEKFWKDVGAATTTLSTQLCFDNSIDPATAVLTYTDKGANAVVPQDASNGWTWDPSLRCIVLHGDWESKYGAFRVSGVGGGGPAGRVCFPSNVDPIPDTIKVTVKGKAVPKSASDGWTYDNPSRCIELNGSWKTNPGPFDVEYL